MNLRTFVLSGFVGELLSALAYRKTEVPNDTVGHKHRFFSFYLTKRLGLRTDDGKTIKPRHPTRLVLWVVPPGMFHEWAGGGTVQDLTPMHPPHKLAV